MTKKLFFNYLTPANFVTVGGAVMAIYSYYCMLTGRALEGVLWYIGACLTDLLDGFVAKTSWIQKIFFGIGKSKLGNILDPGRDFILRCLIIIMALVTNLCLLAPCVIIISGILLIYYRYNRPINKEAGEVSPEWSGKVLHFIDCFIMAIWVFLWMLHVEFGITNINLEAGIVAMVLICISVYLRFHIYCKKYYELFPGGLKS